MSDEDLLINPNLAEVEVLTRLPGIGEVLARRISEARPFTGVEDMLRVPGLGEAALARLTPHLFFEQEIETKEKLEEPVGKRVIAEEKEAPRVALEPHKLKREIERAVYSRGAILWLVIGAAVISIALSVILSLSILGGINRTLNYGQHATVRQLSSDMATLEADVDGLASRLEAIDRRMEAVEGLSGRVKSVENEFLALQEEVKQSLDQVISIRTQIDDLTQEVETLSEGVGRFEAFLDGLQRLLLTDLPATEP